MTISTRLVAAGSLALALVTGVVAAANAQTVIGGEEECSWQKVETVTVFGSYAVIVTTYEKTCVKVLDS
jgi:hypothetical protein